MQDVSLYSCVIQFISIKSIGYENSCLTAYYQSGGISKNPTSLQSAERIDPSALCRVWAFCLARTRFLCKEI